jgi:hypothetical protein
MYVDATLQRSDRNIILCDHILQHLGNFFTQPERVYEKDINKSGAQWSRVTTKTREKENYPQLDFLTQGTEYNRVRSILPKLV